MTTQKILLLILLPLLVSTQLVGMTTPKSIGKALKVSTQDSIDVLQKWAKAIGTDQSKLEALYMDQAIKIIEDSTYLGSSQIAEYYGTKKIKIDDAKRIFETEAHKGRGISYEINSFVTADSHRVSQLVIYQMRGDQKLRTFEFGASQYESLEIDIVRVIERQLIERRTQWMTYCNAHQVSELVNDLYSENTMYYNHRPLVKGREALIKEYGYMNNENYTLSLDPKTIHIVNDSTVFEIGQCEGSYGGKYILIWKKEEDGEWRIFIDSNI